MTRRRTSPTAPETKRCALYTRKSTSVGLEQEFNTLDAQRDACERYVASQVDDGWQVLPGRRLPDSHRRPPRHRR